MTPTTTTTRWNKETLVCQVSFPCCLLPTCCYCAGHWDRGVSAVGDILNVPACRVIEGNLITSPQPPPPASVRNRTEAEQQGHINHKKDSPGSKITLTTLSEQHPDHCRYRALPRWTHPEPHAWFLFFLSLVNLSFPVFQDESNNLIALPFIPQSHLPFLHIFSSLLPTPASPPSLFFFPASSFTPCTPSVYDW